MRNRIYLFTVAVASFMCISCTKTQTTLSENEKAVNPPIMGWSSWNAFRVDISEDIIKHQADLMVEKGLKEQYTPRMKKLSFTQGKLLIKLIDRQSNSTSYELVKAFMGPFKAGFYQTFAALFGASLKKEYDPQGEDKLTERVVLMVENGQI